MIREERGDLSYAKHYEAEIGSHRINVVCARTMISAMYKIIQGGPEMTQHDFRVHCIKFAPL